MTLWKCTTTSVEEHLYGKPEVRLDVDDTLTQGGVNTDAIPRAGRNYYLIPQEYFESVLALRLGINL